MQTMLKAKQAMSSRLLITADLAVPVAFAQQASASRRSAVFR
jgi:hypothetical protein